MHAARAHEHAAAGAKSAQRPRILRSGAGVGVSSDARVNWTVPRSIELCVPGDAGPQANHDRSGTDGQVLRRREPVAGRRGKDGRRALPESPRRRATERGGGLGRGGARAAEPGRVYYEGLMNRKQEDRPQATMVCPTDTRRDFFLKCGGGLGMMALAQMLQADQNPLAPRKSHFPPKAKNVIFLFMEGGPSQIDLFDPKPALEKWHGTPLPPSMTKDLRLAFTKPDAAVLASPRVFKPFGQCGTEFSDWIP